MSAALQARRLAELPTGEPQRTLRTSVTLTGTGLHTGATSTVTIEPAEADRGIEFVVAGTRLPLSPAAVLSTERATTVGADGAQIMTVEHLLAALHGLGVDNASVHVDGPEIPALDGSARPWVEAILTAGVVDQPAEAVAVSPVVPYAVVAGSSCLVAEPAHSTSITCVLHYEHPLLGTQAGAYAVTPATFETELAPARTYGFAMEVQELLQRGLALGGSLENAVVIYEDRYSCALRFPDECLRHKVLDLIGDLFVIGRRFLGHITAVQPGHKLNHCLVRGLYSAADVVPSACSHGSIR